jgi:hypothetical protein
MDMSSLYVGAEQEAQRYLWIESEKAGADLGAVALYCWVRRHWPAFVRMRWLEHLQGKRFWVELDRGDFGLLLRRFPEHALLLDRVLDRLEAGQENLDILRWALDWGIPTAPLLEILELLDLNRRHLPGWFGDAPPYRLDPAWLAWNEGTVVRLARHIDATGDFELLPVLGDALEEAGCTDAAVLAHCHAGGQGVRWSWLVDLILWGVTDASNASARPQAG